MEGNKIVFAYANVLVTGVYFGCNTMYKEVDMEKQTTKENIWRHAITFWTAFPKISLYSSFVMSLFCRRVYGQFDLLYCSLLHMKFLHVLQKDKQCLQIHDIKTMQWKMR